MNAGHTAFLVAVGNPELESFEGAFNDVGVACKGWLADRGLYTPGEIEAAQVLARRKERKRRAN